MKREKNKWKRKGCGIIREDEEKYIKDEMEWKEG